MLPVGQVGNSLISPVKNYVCTLDDTVNVIASVALQILGGMLIAAGIAALIMSVQIPPIALLISGIAVLILEHMSRSEKKEEVAPLSRDSSQRQNVAEEQSVSRVVAPPAVREESAPAIALDRSVAEVTAPPVRSAPAIALDRSVGEVTAPPAAREDSAPAIALDRSVGEITAPPAAREESEPAIAFGREAWIQHIGDPGKVPPLPDNIGEILDGPCPFWPEKRVGDTHVLVLLPKDVTRRTVSGHLIHQPMTLRNLNNMTRSADNSGGAGVGFRFNNELIAERYAETRIPESYWFLMTKKPIPGGTDEAFQGRCLEAAGYKSPTCLEASAAFLLEMIRSKELVFAETLFISSRERVPNQGREYYITVGADRGASLTLSLSTNYKGTTAVRRLESSLNS